MSDVAPSLDATRPTPSAAHGYDIVACHECDLLHRVPRGDGGAHRCIRCGAVVRKPRMPPIDHALSLTIAAGVLLMIANVFPLLGFEISGRIQLTTIVNGGFELWHQGFPELGVLVLLTSVVVPAVRLTAMMAILVPMAFGARPAMARPLIKLVQTLGLWGMADVYLLGVIVAIVKLSSFATLTLGPALYAFVAYVVVSAWQQSAVDPLAIWERLWPMPTPAAPLHR